MVSVTARSLPLRSLDEARESTRAVVFDMDGTLVNTMPVMADLAAEVMADLYGTSLERGRELYLSTCGLPFHEQLELLYPGDERNDGAAQRFEAAKPDLCGDARMSPATRTTLETLRRQGLALAISSNNGHDNVERFVHVNDFPFDLALGFGGGQHKGKPHFDRVAATFGVARPEMLFVGDSLHDADLAASEGVRFVGVTGTFSREQFILLRHPGQRTIRRLSELPRQL